jgi:hypothetical protein
MVRPWPFYAVDIGGTDKLPISKNGCRFVALSVKRAAATPVYAASFNI